jgi:hypothetical protein
VHGTERISEPELIPEDDGGGGRLRTLLLCVIALALLIGPIVFILSTHESKKAGNTAASAKASGPSGPVVGAGAPASWPSWGLTHTEHTPDGPGFSRALTDTAKQHMAQDQAIMGWGTDNPEPSPGRYNFGSLDRRIKLIRTMHGTPIITLCCAPDWMKGGTVGKTDWTKLETAPSAAHYADFAKLAAQVARRYPEVKYYLVWNEFKGFQGTSLNYVGYTNLYNQVYTALKQVNPDLKVGGPYVPMNSNAPGVGQATAVMGSWGSLDQSSLDAVQYWLKNKKGADFLAVDGSAMPDQTKVHLNEFSELTKFSAVTQWLRAQSGGKLPIWWAEWYVQPTGITWTDEHLGAVQAAALMQFISSGAATALYWSPQTVTTGDCMGCMWSGSSAAGAATPTLTMLQNFTRWFPPGTRLVTVTSSNPAVRVLGQQHQMVAVNTSAKPATSTINGTALSLGPYEVHWVDW